jgi:pSer/pThr/pTyr-binding forkhead associated (FHA) protein
MLFGALQQEDVVPRLVLIKGEGTDGVTYHLKGSTQVLGRTEGDIQFEQDIFLSPQHARFTVQAGRLFVQDAGSANGVFLRIKESAALENGDCFLAGEQLLRVDLKEVPAQTPTTTGTYFYGSPRVTSKFRVTQLLAGGSEGIMACSEDSLLSIGREGNILDFPDDNFISGRHAQLHANGPSGVTLEDLGSRNGTFHRVRGAKELHSGDYVFIGQQLFRVEIS